MPGNPWDERRSDRADRKLELSLAWGRRPSDWHPFCACLPQQFLKGMLPIFKQHSTIERETHASGLIPWQQALLLRRSKL